MFHLLVQMSVCILNEKENKWITVFSIPKAKPLHAFIVVFFVNITYKT